MDKKEMYAESERMRVMWLSINASLFNIEKTSGGWTSSLEAALKKYHGEEMEIAVVYEGSESSSGRRTPEKHSCDGSVYYRISNRSSMPSKALRRPDAYDRWEYIRPEILAAIEDFEPDIIQCFGSEWPYGMITADVDIPVVIHMQGFLNAYAMSGKLLPRNDSMRRLIGSHVPQIIKRHIRTADRQEELERETMRINHYFMGRTGWDKNLVKYFSPGSVYYHVPELIRHCFYDAAGTWKGASSKDGDGRARLLTVSQASPLKGNEIILYTAKILKEQTGTEFEWRVAGSPGMFRSAEKTTGINHRDVNIELLGWINQDRIISELQTADFFIHPSIIDNSPNAICEAQLIGCPIIASNVGGVPDLVESGRTGVLYPYNEPHTLAFIIAELKDQPWRLGELSRNESSAAYARHDPQIVAEEVCRRYKEIIIDHNKNKTKDNDKRKKS